MISKKEKERLKKILGHRYVALVTEELDNDEVLNESEDKYSSSMIINVMNGKQHKLLESYIYKAAETAVAQKLIEKSRRKRILKSAS